MYSRAHFPDDFFFFSFPLFWVLELGFAPFFSEMMSKKVGSG